MTATHIFLDFDNTLSDMSRHRAQFVQALSGKLAAEFGGSAEDWSAVLARELVESIGRYARMFAGDPLVGFGRWLEEERVHATLGIFRAMGRPIPDNEPVADLARRLQFEGLTACNALIEGVPAALEEITTMGLQIHMASAQESEYLLAALLGAGVESYVNSKFGGDLIDCAKEGPEFYHRIFGNLGISPTQAVVVDDQAMCLDWAEECGARVVQAALLPDSPEPEFPIVLRRFSDLPRLLNTGIA